MARTLASDPGRVDLLMVSSSRAEPPVDHRSCDRPNDARDDRGKESPGRLPVSHRARLPARLVGKHEAHEDDVSPVYERSYAASLRLSHSSASTGSAFAVRAHTPPPSSPRSSPSRSSIALRMYR